MRTVTLIAGVVCLFAVLLDAFQTIILPRRASGRFRLTRIFYIATWKPWAFFARRLRDPRKRETVFSYYGPMSLIFLLVVWASAMVVGFALVFHSLGSPFIDTSQTPGFRTDLYVSGTTIFTLGLGDVVPHSAVARELIILEAGTGFGFLAVVMGYFPVLYGAFSRREVSISLLDARAGSPPTAAELLRRHSYEGGENALSLLLGRVGTLVGGTAREPHLLSAALLLPLPTHQSKLDQRPHFSAGHLGIADLRRAGTRGATGPANLCHGTPCDGRSCADFLACPCDWCTRPAAARAVRTALSNALRERYQSLPRWSVLSATARYARALRGICRSAQRLSAHAAAAMDRRPAAQRQLARRRQTARPDRGSQRTNYKPGRPPTRQNKASPPWSMTTTISEASDLSRKRFQALPALAVSNASTNSR